ncbi:hypothetical protein [Virgibacillus sp. DJP39]|uniref:hypothetical protein n=1 Tax=Virgibacillus sp. DJP39 TaxID=3409790 RepID=UPI003BB7B87C
MEMNTSAMIRNNAIIKGLIENDAIVDLLTIEAIESNPAYDKTLNWDKRINIISLKGNNLYKSFVKSERSVIGKLKKSLLPIIRRMYHSFNLFDNTIYIAKGANHNILPSKYYDLIISSSDPKSSHIAVHKLIKSGLRYGRWIQYWGDPLTIDITKKSIYPNILIKKIENQIFYNADRLVYVSPFTLEKQKKLFPNYADKMIFLPVPYIREKKYKNNSRENKKVTIGYFGDYYTKIRNIENLYSVCQQEKFNLIIAGNSNVELLNTKNITILPRISQNQVEELEARCDILICILNKTGTQIPAKIYHYAATNRPILILVHKNQEQMSKYLESFSRFVICENEYESVKKAIKSIMKSKKEYEPLPFLNSKNISKQLLNLGNRGGE